MAKNQSLNIPIIGKLALKSLLITKYELQQGMVVCSDSTDKSKALKEYFELNELISFKNLQRLAKAAKALEFRKKEFKFGEIAIKKNFINNSVLTLALDDQKNAIKKGNKVSQIGEMLVDAGFLTAKQRNSVLKLQKRFRKKYLQSSAKINQAIDTKKNNDILKKPLNSTKKITEEQGLLLASETISNGLKLEISRDLMTAFLTKTDSFDEAVTVDQIKDSLFDKKIVSGIVVDQMIQGFISSQGFKLKAFKIAQGINPIEGKNAEVEFFFNTSYLKAGGMSTDGIIDFKDRGLIPYTNEGTVLAEKIPMVESRHGLNIYGNRIETVKGIDFAWKYGTGVKISEDGRKLIAAVKGFPKYSLAGRVFVYNEYTTQGDVDYETGHINYDGNVNVTGRIKSGFKVTGNDIRAIELDGGDIIADGNVHITGGINSSNIYARGSVYAKFMHNSKVQCLGDVMIASEVVDSQIECSGECAVTAGKIISSNITSKLGVKAKDIGSEKAKSCIINIGHDIFTTKELTKIKVRVDSLTTRMRELKKVKEELRLKSNSIQKKITEYAHIQDRAQLEEKELNSKIATMGKNADKRLSVEEMHNDINLLQESAKNAEKTLNICFNKSENLDVLIAKEDDKLQSLEKKYQDLLAERDNLLQWAKEYRHKNTSCKSYRDSTCYERGKTENCI